MEIRRIGTQASSKGPSDWITGTVRIDPLFQAPAPARVQGAAIVGNETDIANRENANAVVIITFFVHPAFGDFIIIIICRIDHNAEQKIKL